MRLLERYRLGPLLGEGGYGSVFRAQDTLMNREVAVKRVRHLQDRKQLAEIYKEIAILRMLNAPGVVRFLDQGEDETYVYIITALVEGRPFLAGRATWPEMVDEVSRLLSTLDQIHAVGLVHRDLKPANILVNADGQPILLDFGITQSVHPQHAFNQGGGVCGTPAYIAPEQLDEGGVITPATDLYSLGVILFEALAQAQPFEGNDPQALLWARALRPARPLGPLAPTAPPAITALVDDLLQREIDARPRSALEVLARIKRGQVEAPRLVHAGALLGREAILTRLLEDARAGRSIHLVGPPGSGRSATLAALRRRLRAEGRQALTLTRRRAPFGSLGALTEGLISQEALSLEAALLEAEEATRAFLREGGVLIADDADGFDACAQEVLIHAAPAGAVICVGLEIGAPLTLPDLRPEDLEDLFSGMDALFHARQDAARALWRRTGGRAARLAGELRAWEEAGLAIPRGARYVISPEGLAQLRSGALLTPPYAPPPPINLDEIDRQRLTLLRWCWPHTDTARLAQLTGTPRWRLEADLEDLQRRGLAERLDDDLWLPLARCDAPAWNASALIAGRGEGEPEGFVRTGRAAPLIGFESAQDFHGRLAKQLELTSLARFQRFLLSRQSLYTLWEAIQVIRRALEESTLERAHAVFEQVLPLLPDLVGPEFMRVDLTRQLMKLRVALAFAENTPQGFSLALYALVRFSPQIGEAEARLEGLLKLGADLFGAGSGEVLKVLLSQPIPEDIEEARWRQQLMVLAAWFQPLEVEQAVLKRIDEEIAARPELAGPQLALLRGRSAYRQERYAEALEHYEAARQSPRLLDRVKASLAIGSTALDSGDIARCEASARAALEALGALHEPYIEARATYLLRASRYRAGALEAPDEALIEAAGLACAGYYEALILLVEAAFAWRLGDDAAARRWSARAAEIWGEQSHGAKALADALCYVAGGEGDPIAALEAAKALEPDLIAAQVIGLICARHPHPQRAAWIEARLQGRVIDRALRRELISIDEALTLRAPRSAPLAMSPAAPAETARDHSR